MLRGSRNRTEARPLPVSVVRAWILVGLALTAIHVLRLAGPSSEAALSLLTAGAIGMTIYAPLRNRPPVRGPWVSLVVAAALFAVGADDARVHEHHRRPDRRPQPHAGLLHVARATSR